MFMLYNKEIKLTDQFEIFKIEYIIMPIRFNLIELNKSYIGFESTIKYKRALIVFRE